MQTSYLLSLPYAKRLRPLFCVQFLGVFNDSAFKMLSILAILGSLSDYLKNSVFLLLMIVAYILPFFLMTAPAGAFSDRLQKRTVLVLMKLAELAVLLIGTLCLVNAEPWGMVPILCVVFLLTAQTSFFSPAFNAILPETFCNRELARANGDLGTVSVFAVISGILSAPLIRSICLSLSGGIAERYPHLQSSEFLLSGLVLVFFSLVGFFISLEIQPTAEYEDSFRNEERPGLFNSVWIGMKALCRRKSILFSAMGDSFFLGICIAVLFLLIPFVRHELPENGGGIEVAMFLLAPMVGFGIGCFLSGRFSGGKIELGHVPYGSFGMAVFLSLAALLPGFPVTVYGFLFHPLALFWLFLGGISGGFFVIPLRAFLQQALRPASRGAALACGNAISALFILVFLTLALLLTVGSVPAAENAPAYIGELAARIPAFSIAQILFGIGILILIVTVLSVCLFPDLFIRAGVLLLANTLYKVRVSGLENIPDKGPVLLVANHVSLVDSLLITYCCSRKVRFLMHEDYYNLPVVRLFAKMSRVIMVPSARHVKKMQEMFDITRQALNDGYAVCIFPEGKITKNGLMDDFKAGYSMMLPEDREVPVIPVYIGLIWGSIFSYYYGEIKPRFPSQFQYPAAIAFGKPMQQPFTAFQMRQTVSELGAEAEMMPRDSERTIHYQLAKQAMRHPFRELMRDYDGRSFNNFQTLVASILFSREIRRMMPESTKYVGVMLPNTTAAALSVLGTIMADKVPAPLNFTASAETLRNSISKAGITHILTSRKFLLKLKREPIPEMVFLEDLAPKIPKWKKLLWAAAAIVLRHQELMNFVSPLTHRNLFAPAVLLFSSGSTGNPKGVLLSHRNMNSDVYSVMRVMGFTTDDRVLGSLPLFHSFGFTTNFWLPIAICAKVVYVTSPLDAATVGNAVEKFKLTLLLATPTFIQSYMKRCPPEQFRSLRLAIVGAEKLRHDILRKFVETTGGRMTLVEGYGCTELSPIVSINVGRTIMELGQSIGKKGSIGVAMPGICVKIVDPVTREELPADTDGLMLVKGPTVMIGYLNDPAQTGRVISNGWYETGDIASMDNDGYITISGRLSRFSKIAGEMVPHEMLECILNELSGSEDRVFAVGGIPDPSKGEALLVLYVKTYAFSPEEMNTKLRAKNLPNLWIPKTANYRAIDALPMLGNGKLDLLKLQEIVKSYS